MLKSDSEQLPATTEKKQTFLTQEYQATCTFNIIWPH